MYEKPILKRFGKLREITRRIVALEPIATSPLPTGQSSPPASTDHKAN